MMKITQDMDYEGDDQPVKKLVCDLKEYHEQSPFATGIDWQWQQYWATMTDLQAFAFVLKHPEYIKRFTRIHENVKTEA
jgi:hypothetical protein